MSLNISEYIILASVFFIIILPVSILLINKIVKKQNTGQDENRQMILSLIESLRQETAASNNQSRLEIQQRFEMLNQQLSKNSQESFRAIQTQFKQSAGIITDVTRRLTEIDKTNRQVLDFTSKLQSLENILKNPKQRGILGEYFLETLLGNVLQPGQYKMQYRFTNGEIVDAAVFYRDKIIPVDAKFSLEKYNRIMETADPDIRSHLEKEFRNDIKRRIDETSKYIRPEENTTDFAFMFIPAEGVYYSLLTYKVGNALTSGTDLVEYAFGRHVIIVSPTSFFAYLETVLQGLKAQKVEENIREIIKRINDLGKHMATYEAFMEKLGRNLSAAVGNYNQASREFKKIDKDIYKITEGESGGAVDAVLLDRPSEEFN